MSGNGNGNGNGDGYRVPRCMEGGDVVLEPGQIGPVDLASAALAEIHKAFKAHNVTPERLAAKLNKLLDAKKVVTATFEGNITDEKEYDDGALQHAAVVTALKAGGFWVERSQMEINKRQTVLIIGGIDRTPVDGGKFIDIDKPGPGV